jgi:hypothetical protein
MQMEVNRQLQYLQEKVRMFLLHAYRLEYHSPSPGLRERAWR